MSLRACRWTGGLRGRFLGLGLLVVAAGLAQADGLQTGDRVAVCGDSITEQKLYSVMIESYLLMCQPAAKLTALQFGWGGETAQGFYSRMANDCLPFKPSVATTCYGMNDGRYSPPNEGTLKWYEDNQRNIVKSFKKAGVRLIVVGSPGVVDSDTFRGNPELATMYNKTLAAERDLSKKVAAEEQVVFANVFDAMMDTMVQAKAKYGKGYAFAGNDGVHPGPNGHLVMAYAFLKALGCDGNLGSVKVDLGAGKAEAEGGHKVLSSQGGTVELESTRYPFCFSGDPASSNATSGVIQFCPFNQDLNRLTLVVTGTNAAKLKVTWGGQSKEFAAADLAKGINLAAEFLNNPFSQPFAAVMGRIHAKQSVETPGVKEGLHNLLALGRLLPDEKESVERIRTKLVEKLADGADKMPAAVVPVKHTLKIEPAG